VASQKLGIDTIRKDTFLRLQPHIVNSVELGKSPLPALNDLLATRELELSPPQSLTSIVLVAVLAPNREQHLSDINPSASPKRLPEGAPHTSLKPIGSGAREHLVDPEHVKRVNPNA